MLRSCLRFPVATLTAKWMVLSTRLRWRAVAGAQAGRQYRMYGKARDEALNQCFGGGSGKQVLQLVDGDEGAKPALWGFTHWCGNAS